MSAPAIMTDSETTGLTLPGMMLLPGCNASNSISPSPVKGPLFIQRRSFAIFIKVSAIFLTTEEACIAASCELKDMK